MDFVVYRDVSALDELQQLLDAAVGGEGVAVEDTGLILGEESAVAIPVEEVTQNEFGIEVFMDAVDTAVSVIGACDAQRDRQVASDTTIIAIPTSRLQ